MESAAVRRVRQLPGIDPHEHRIAHRRQHFPGVHLADHPSLAPDVAFDAREELDGHIRTYARNRDLLLAALPAMGLDRIAPPPGRVPVNRPAAAPVQVRYDRAWLDRRPPAAARDAEWRCMAIALYFEARGEPVKGQFAVAEVILNRVADPRYPDSICAVVNQTCQFSFTCDGQPERIREPEAFARVGKVADLMMGGVPRRLTDGATHFHTRNVRPDWSRRLPKTAQIGDHVFYRPGRVN